MLRAVSRIKWKKVFFSVLLMNWGFLTNCRSPVPSAPERPARPAAAEDRLSERLHMVEQQLAGRDIHNRQVLEAMRRVPRHLFIPAENRPDAYEDNPVPIGFGQTISQPYIVGFMTQALRLKGGEKILEIGTGSGYQAAVLAEVGARVYTIEIIEPLAREADARLKSLGYASIQVRCGDGYQGWPEEAPFDAVIVTAAPERIPQPLIDQLAEGGSMIIPVGVFTQDLILLQKTPEGLRKKAILPVRFVPMTGKAQIAAPPR